MKAHTHNSAYKK